MMFAKRTRAALDAAAGGLLARLARTFELGFSPDLMVETGW
ncbi:hypothetical protein [Streptomonospora salina]|uniref:Uncharacterized protein n=1 Tax=Streptomonospora salina TaxID=104205 RepID=A0A841E2B2_9ACTN|nr:hypothetical protein [Streptomonospora salina]MBB5996604.1 hypothetical protein [Streptomonospora salina]